MKYGVDLIGYTVYGIRHGADRRLYTIDDPHDEVTAPRERLGCKSLDIGNRIIKARLNRVVDLRDRRRNGLFHTVPDIGDGVLYRIHHRRDKAADRRPDGAHRSLDRGKHGTDHGVDRIPDRREDPQQRGERCRKEVCDRGPDRFNETLQRRKKRCQEGDDASPYLLDLRADRIHCHPDKDLDRLEELAAHLKSNSLCALGQTAPNPVLSTLRYFKDEYIAHIVDKKCPAGVCKDLLQYKIDADKCKGCTLCARTCPNGAIIGKVKEPHMINQDKCVKCGACMEKCRFGAIYKE